MTCFSREVSQLPEFLRCFTAEAAFTRVYNQAVELFQFQRKYTEAVKLLTQLIDGDIFHLDYRGRWYERLALNLDFHLKQHNKASSLFDEKIK